MCRSHLRAHVTQLARQGTISCMSSAGARLSSRLLSGRKEIWRDVLGVCGLAAVAVLLRCLRLSDSGSNYIFNPDSYFFNWVSQRVMAGESPPSGTLGVNYTLHSGFAYPAACTGKSDPQTG